MTKGNKKPAGCKKNLKEYVGKDVCVLDSKKVQWIGQVLKVREETDEEDSIIVKLPFGHIVFWESNIVNISTYQPKKTVS